MLKVPLSCGWGVFMLVGEMALEIRLLAKRGKGLRAIAREVELSVHRQII